MIDKLIQLYKKLSIKTRKVIVLVIAFAVAFTTVHLLTFPATAITRSAGLEDPGITVGTEAGDEPADTITEEEFGVRTENQMPEETGPEALPEEVSEENPTNEAGTDELDSAEVSAAPAAAEETVDPASTEEPVNEEDAERDPEADTEDASDWEELFREIEQTGVWADDLIALAETQIGYTESERNFITDEEGRKHGYTRYGAWYGDSYRTWDSLFILFNLHYAGITEQDFPYEADCEDWVESLKEAEMFREVDTYIPGKGDLVFADTDDDGVTDHAAIVRKVVFNLEGRPEELVVVEGDTDNAVRENRYEFYNPLITGFAQLPENPELAEQEPQVFALTGSANRVDVTVLYEEGAFPEGTTMEVKTVGNRNVITAINETVSEENKEVVRVQAVDIIFRDTEGTEIEPRKPIRVTMKSRSVPQAATEKPVVVHVDDNAGPAVIETSTPEDEPEDTREAVTFEAGSFSIYAIVYTVDFHWEANGQTFDFSIPGGGFVSLEHLVEALGISEAETYYPNRTEPAEESIQESEEAISETEGNDGTTETEEHNPGEESGTDVRNVLFEEAISLNRIPVSENTKKFVAEVERVDFSSPELVWIGKVEETAAVGTIKESNGLNVEYSADLSQSQIEEINAQTLEAGDWALISVLPFSNEETLTVTMKNGDRFTVQVTDAQLSKTFITSEGETYRVTVIYDDSAMIPEGAELEVREIIEGEAHDDLTARVQQVMESSVLSFLRLFDIGISFKGETVEPASDVQVIIEYIDGNQPQEADKISIVHFAQDGAEVLPASADTNSDGIMEVSFTTESFSPFATVSERINNTDISSSVIAFFNFDELNDQNGFTSNVNGITAYASPIVSGAKPDLSPAYDGNVLKLNNSNDDALRVTKSDGTSLLTGLNQMTISYWAYTTNNDTSWAYYAAQNGNPPVYSSEHYIGAFHNGGNLNEERYHNGRGGGNYSIVTPASTGAWHYVTVVYGPDTTTVYVDGEQKASKNGQPSLTELLGNNSIFQIGKANWGNGEYFSGYLDEMMIMNRALTKAEVVSLYQSGYAQNVAPAKQDKIDITSLVKYTLEHGVNTVTEEGAPVPPDSYRTTYPGKVLTDVIFFATEYNESEYNYDYYAVTHDGGLVKVTDLGSEIMWKDPRDIKWDLIVYTGTDAAPTGYYELAYKDSEGNSHFLAPQLNTDSLLQGETLGLQFAGVTAGTHGTTIEAWDADDREYAGIQISHEKLTAVPERAAEEFFFARNTKNIDYSEPRSVATVESAQKGIQISLFDYNGGNNGRRPDWMTDLIGDGPYRSGHQVTVDLVKHNLKNGVPVASMTGNSLDELFGGETGAHVDHVYNNVNHLFLQGTYDETGYFSYNSAQNYAYYNDGNFIVYDQAAAPNGTGSANYHGNFFPFNTFGEASNSQYMWYDVNDTLLTPDDPEYGTALRSLSNIDYTFGMQMTTDFYMTKYGVDERGRDIVYEFNGDDDLWVFVDDKLALDIGGVHGAIHGTINFTTGEIIVASENLYSVTGETSPQWQTIPGSIHTTLADQFRKAYKEQGKSDAEITALLDATFNKDSSGKYTSFKPYTTHNLKMFYMESGMGASNLNIRFNLPVVPPASFTIEKELPEAVQATYTDRRFAFEVYVQNEYDSEQYTKITQDQIGEGKLIKSAVYENTTTPATFDVNGILYLHPEEAVQLTISDERLKYYVKEVQIDTDMWGNPNINHVSTVISSDGSAESDAQMVSQRGRVVFENVPKNVQSLLINKVVESGDPQSVDPNLEFEFYVYLEGHSGTLEPYSVGEYYLTKTVGGQKHYFNNAYNDLGTEPQVCSRSGQYGSIGNIRAGYTIEIPGLLPGTDFYVVEREDRIPDGLIFIRKTLTKGSYDPADSNIYLVQNGTSIAPDGKIKAGSDAEVTIFNGDITVNLIKVDARDMKTPLADAQFTLTKLNPEGNGTYIDGSERTSGVTGTNGETRIAGIRNGYYEINETAFPKGYIKGEEGTFYIKVHNGTVILLEKDTSKKVSEWTERTLTDQDKLKFDKRTLTFTVGNTPGTALPKTGGTGTHLFTILGGILILCAGILLVRKQQCD